MAKKKKKNRAQAAAARHEETPESISRAKAKERTKLIKQSAKAAEKKARQASGFRLLVPILLVAAIIISALAFTIGPGMIMGK